MIVSKPVDLAALKAVIDEAKSLARQYREITGKPLGITGEVGEYIAAELLGLELTEARQPGYDAIASDGHKIQIKTRCVKNTSSQGRLGSIRLDHEWNTVILVLMDADFELLEMHEASRPDIEMELKKPGSRARNERGALSIGKFKSIASLVWSTGTKS